RDEAHRFAVAFHRRRRGSLTLRSALADVPGIGPQRQRLLLRHFGSLKKIREAAPEELAAVPGMTAKSAAAVSRYLAAVGVVPVAASGAASGAASVAAAVISSAVAETGSTQPSGGDAEEEALENAFADVEDETDDAPIELASRRPA
ncbi:MAG: hypothetical protein H7X95_12960, partial [Deltaproteobacteria bacterium]|nr:hypothetical protein [Deltaproteobacteria bacterium]